MKKLGSLFIALGVLLVMFSLTLTAYNIITDKKGSEAAQKTASQLDEIIPQQTKDGEIPLLFGSFDMPQVELDGEMYVGTISIPEINLNLPVASGVTDKTLRKGPCLYSGSVYKKDAIVCGHNYSGHFRRLSSLGIGSQFTFTDSAGRTYEYSVTEVILIDGYDVEQMVEEDNWDITLFTCNYSGRSRITLRARLVEA